MAKKKKKKAAKRKRGGDVPKLGRREAISIKLKWSGVLPWLLHIVKSSGDREAIAQAESEIIRLGRIVDALIDDGLERIKVKR